VTGDTRASPAGETRAGGSSVRRVPLGLWAALVRVLQNRLLEGRQVARLFDDAAFSRIEAAIAAGEARHRGEIRFALEQDLSFDAARRAAASREHALATFSQHGIWDTEENSGILVFLQWPLHAIEIVADRGVASRVSPQLWTDAVARIALGCERGAPVDGIVEAIALIHDALAEAMPYEAGDRNELSDRPIRL
jgi:uncharacterized membrane protein